MKYLIMVFAGAGLLGALAASFGYVDNNIWLLRGCFGLAFLMGASGMVVPLRPWHAMVAFGAFGVAAIHLRIWRWPFFDSTGIVHPDVLHETWIVASILFGGALISVLAVLNGGERAKPRTG